MLLHVLLCLLCILISIQLQHNVYDTATRHSAATCDYRSNRAVVNARAFNKHSIRDNSASYMLQLSNDCDTVVNWCKYQAAKPAAVDLRPHGTNLQTEHESVCMHTMHCSSPKTKQLLNHRLHAQRRKPHAKSGANDAVRTTKFVTVTPSANTPTNITPATVTTTITAPLSQHKCRLLHWLRAQHAFGICVTKSEALTPAVDCLVVTSSAVTHAQTYNAWHACGVSGIPSSSTPPPSSTCGTITNYYPNRVYTPHVAANPANNHTPNHDPDKQ